MTTSTLIIDGEDMAELQAFFATRPEINASRFIRSAIMKAIYETWTNEFESLIDRINEHQRAFGGPELK